MPDINLYRKEWGKPYDKTKFKSSFDALLTVCKEMDGDYNEKHSLYGEPHGNMCKMGNGIELLGWRDSNRIDVNDMGRDIIVDVGDISINKWRDDDELNLRWGADWMDKDEGVHGHLNISKERGLASINVSEFKNHADSPVFTMYTKNMR